MVYSKTCSDSIAGCKYVGRWRVSAIVEQCGNTSVKHITWYFDVFFRTTISAFLDDTLSS